MPIGKTFANLKLHRRAEQRRKRLLSKKKKKSQSSSCHTSYTPGEAGPVRTGQAEAGSGLTRSSSRDKEMWNNEVIFPTRQDMANNKVNVMLMLG